MSSDFVGVIRLAAIALLLGAVGIFYYQPALFVAAYVGIKAIVQISRIARNRDAGDSPYLTSTSDEGSSDDGPSEKADTDNAAKPIPLLVIGLAFIGFAFLMFQSTQPLDGGIETTGEVLEIRRFNNSTRKPRIQFQTETGQTIEFISNHNTGLRTGQEVTVSYPPDAPEDAKLTDTSIRPIALLVGFLGMLSFVAGLRMLGQRRQTRDDAVDGYKVSS